jgi:hypothetical protein
MARRSPARFLAPIALLAVVGGAFVIVEHGLHHKKPRRTVTQSSTSGATLPVTPGGRRGRRPPPRFYVVKAGDNLSTISARTHVPLPTLEALNPKVNPQSLQTGQRLRLRR